MGKTTRHPLGACQANDGHGRLYRLGAGVMAAAVACAAAPNGDRDAAPARPGGAVPRVASREATRPTTAAPAADPVAQAKAAILACRAKFASVSDYSCTFVKRERIGGALGVQSVMHMKARTNPTSVYFKFQKPNKGREAIYVAGRNGGRVTAHDVGIGKFIAGTMNLDPRGSMAMEDNRHPITDAGLGALIETVAKHWLGELRPGESVVTLNAAMRVGKHPCTMIESVHPQRSPNYLHHKVRLYIDHEHGLPIRFEAYDWPKHPGAAPQLLEEYTYVDLRVNVGLSEHDFDPGNRAYSFGRF